MTEYKNRAERRSFQRVELRKIRTEYKQSMKAFRSKCLDYNFKKFRKTLSYYQCKQASKTNAAVDITVICEYQEGTSPQTDTDMPLYNYECTPATEVFFPR